MIIIWISGQTGGVVDPNPTPDVSYTDGFTSSVSGENLGSGYGSGIA